MTETSEIKTRIKLFFDRKLKVHITKKDIGFENGTIISMKKNFLELSSERNQKVLIISYSEIKDIEKYMERKQ